MASTKTSATQSSTVKLKLMIDKKANKVLFAEAGKDFVDILFNLLYLPFGTVAGLIGIVDKVCCAGNLYQSLENLNESYLHHNQNKVELLKPISKEYVVLQPLACPQPSEQKKLDMSPNNHLCVTVQKDRTCLQFIRLMDQEVKPKTVQCGIVKKEVTFMVKDDLSVTPGSMIAGISMLQANVVVENIDYVEGRTVEIGTDEVLELLKASLQSKAALTTVFLEEKNKAVTNKSKLRGINLS